MQNPQPISPRKQLSAFYKAQGLQGKQARKAIQADMRRVRELFRSENEMRIAELGFEGAWYRSASSGIAGLFSFMRAREGITYWADRARMLGGM